MVFGEESTDLKRNPMVTQVPTIAPQLKSPFTGKAGEFATSSELLFYGYNASAMAVDDGIDIIASKEKDYFHIQVKTANSSDNGAHQFSIQRKRFEVKHSYQTFYIFLLRAHDQYRYFNDYLILPSIQIRQFIETGVIKDSPNFSIRVQKDRQGRFILNAKLDVTISINTFSQIC